MRAYFRDVNDHLLRVHEQVESYRELLTGVLEANLTQVDRAPERGRAQDLRMVAIMAVPTAIAGIYGMNFEHMPELGWEFGYPLLLALMAVICFTLYRSSSAWAGLTTR